LDRFARGPLLKCKRDRCEIDPPAGNAGKAEDLRSGLWLEVELKVCRVFVIVHKSQKCIPLFREWKSTSS
jgi:hypothetical protein